MYYRQPKTNNRLDYNPVVEAELKTVKFSNFSHAVGYFLKKILSQRGAGGWGWGKNILNPPPLASMDVIHIQIFPFEKCCALGYNFKNQNTIVDNFLAVIFCLVIEPLARKLLLRYEA